MSVKFCRWVARPLAGECSRHRRHHRQSPAITGRVRQNCRHMINHPATPQSWQIAQATLLLIENACGQTAKPLSGSNSLTLSPSRSSIRSDQFGNQAGCFQDVTGAAGVIQVGCCRIDANMSVDHRKNVFRTVRIFGGSRAIRVG